MATRSFELVSFRLCPFAQRAVALLVHKGIEHKLTFIDLSDPPDWFATVSPLGKVPVLRVDGATSVFESAVISEFLDEVTPLQLMPCDPLVRASNRSWIEHASAALMPLRDLTTVETADALRAVHDDFLHKLEPLEKVLGDGPYFNGPDVSLVDFAYAPMFVRLDYFATYLGDVVPTSRLPMVAAWHQALIRLDAVKNSVGDDFAVHMDALVAKRQGYLASLLLDVVQTTGPRQEY